MLILSRRPTESFMVGEDVRVEVLGVQGNQVRLGIRAPREVPVHREEVFRRINAGQQRDGVARFGAAGDGSSIPSSPVQAPPASKS